MEYEEEVFESFAAEGIIAEFDSVVKSGKEATVYKCRASESVRGSLGTDFVAVKVYKDIEQRSFRNMGGYLDGRIGRTIRKRRDILHMLSTPASMQAFWVNAEYEALGTLHAAGLSVPKPLFRSGNSLAMEFVSAADGSGDSAWRLRDARLEAGSIQALCDRVLESIEIMLRHDMIHGDLSPYNILMRGHEPVIIDFPQVIDARYHSQAAAMLQRDIVNVADFFERKGAVFSVSPCQLADDLWSRYYRNEL